MRTTSAGLRVGTAGPLDGQRGAHRNSLAIRIGFWSAILAASAAIGFTVGVVVASTVSPQVKWTGDAAAFARSFKTLPFVIGEIFSLLIIPGWLGLVVAVHALAPPERRPLTLMALVLTGAYVATVGANDLLQITTVRLNLEAGTTTGLDLFIKDNPHSLFYPIEGLGYAWQSAAAFLVGVVFAGGGIQRWIRWLFGAVAVSGAMGIVAAILGLDVLDPFFLAGLALWGVAFPAGVALCAVVFRRLSRAGAPQAP